MKTKIYNVFICVLLLFVVLAGCGQPVSSETASLASGAVSEAALSSIAVSSVAVSKAAVSSAAANPSSQIVSAASLATSSQTVSLDTWNEKGYRITELTEPVKVDGIAMGSFTAFDEEKIMKSTKVIVRCEVLGGPKSYFTEYMDSYGPDRRIFQTYQIRIEKVLYSDGVVKEGDVIGVLGGQILCSVEDEDGNYKKHAANGYPKLTKGKHMYIFLGSIPAWVFEDEKKKNTTFNTAQFAVAQYSVGNWYRSIDILGDNEYQYDCDAFPFFEEWAQVTQPRTYVGPGSIVKVRHSNFDGLILQLVEKHKDIIASRYREN